MGLFKKRKAEAAPVPAAEASAPAEQETPPARRVQTAALSSGRMAALYQKLYLWIFSVNITADVYQIESGSDSFPDAPLDIRGYYHILLERLSGMLLEEQREEFCTAFGGDNLRAAVAEGKTAVRGLFCGQFQENPEKADAGQWYEIRAEWQREVNPQNIVLVLYVRSAQSDLDRGDRRTGRAAPAEVLTPDMDWDTVRSRCLRYSGEGMNFEYSIGEDCWYLHRQPGDPEGDRVTPRFLATLHSRADFEVSHESIATLRQMLRERSGGAEEAVVLYRRAGTYGAPFCHYRMMAAPVTVQDGSGWIVGRLENVEAEFNLNRQNEEMARELTRMLQTFRISMFHINTHTDQIFAIEQDDSGFHRQEAPQRLSEYIKKRVASGRIPPESRDEYLRWLEKGYLQRQTAAKPYEFEALLKEPGDLGFRWYSETIMEIQGKQGQFIRWRRDDTEGHEARDAAYESKELAHISQYNSQMLDAVASLVEFRSIESSNHISRVRQLTKILLEDLQKRSPQYELSNREIFMYIQASTMHDIGKITVPDYILNKEGRYTPEEFEIMKKHTTDGAAIVDRLNIPGQEQLKSVIRDVVRHHHERYDGNGYPDGLVGDANPIGVQAVSLADVYDALVSERCYKKGYVPDEAMHMILDGKCGEFNPCVIESLKACVDRMNAIYDTDEEMLEKRE